MSIQLTILFLSQCHFVTLSLHALQQNVHFYSPSSLLQELLSVLTAQLPFLTLQSGKSSIWKESIWFSTEMFPRESFPKWASTILLSSLSYPWSCTSPVSAAVFHQESPPCFPAGAMAQVSVPGLAQSTTGSWSKVPRAAGAKLLPGNHRTLLAHQAVSGQVCFAERLFLRASVWWGRECQGHHCIVSLGRKLFTSVWEMGFQMAPSFKCSLCCVLCVLSAEHWLPQACVDPRLMRCDPRNTGQVCLALIANDRFGQEELTVIFNFFSSPSCLWDYSPYPQRVGSSKWDLCFPKLPF